MSTIGNFKKQGNGTFTGRIQTATLNLNVNIVPVKPGNKPSAIAPDYRVYTTDNNVELGAGWDRKGQTSQQDYVFLKLDDPSFNGAIIANLVKEQSNADAKDKKQTGNIYTLIWSR